MHLQLMLLLFLKVFQSIFAGSLPDDHLTITITDSSHDGRYQLSCHPSIGGNHPHPKEACEELDQEKTDPFAPVSKTAMCSQVYGGDDRALVNGTWAGKSVKTEFNRKNGCEIARWDKVGVLLGKKV